MNNDLQIDRGVFPVRHLTVDVKGVRIFYRGAGPPNAPVILLLHGLPSSSRMFGT